MYADDIFMGSYVGIGNFIHMASHPPRPGARVAEGEQLSAGGLWRVARARSSPRGHSRRAHGESGHGTVAFGAADLGNGGVYVFRLSWRIGMSSNRTPLHMSFINLG